MPNQWAHLKSLILFVLGALLATPSHGFEADFRLKWFGTASALPSHDVQRQTLQTPGYDSNLDLRIMLQHEVGDVRLLLDHSTVLLSGDVVALGNGPNSSVDQTVTNDSRRWADLTWEIEEGDRHQSFHRLDRLALQWQKNNWSVTFGRQAVSWGSGIVFQPLDLFSPFSPTVVDRDYKAGDDLLLVDHLLDNGQDLQLLHVVRRDDQEDVTSDVSSTALKWHGYLSSLEFEFIGAKHFDESIIGLSLRMPAGQALVRADIVATRHQSLVGADDEWRVSGILNADVTFTVGRRNAYCFVEYFHNDWGVSDLPTSALMLPLALQQRLGRGELFNLMRDYVAVGGNFEWHPLVSQNLVLISNLHDSSSLLQVGFTYEPGDRQNVEFGWIEPLGRAGQEFGGVPLAGNELTTGGGSRIYLRWGYFF